MEPVLSALLCQLYCQVNPNWVLLVRKTGRLSIGKTTSNVFDSNQSTEYDKRKIMVALLMSICRVIDKII